MNKVSCLTVTKNRVPFLEKCLKHFIEQTHENKELVIVYYNTDNDTEKYLKSQQERLDENNIKIVKFIEDDGFHLGAVRNIGLSQLTGDWVCIWDDDDWYANDRIEKQLKFCLDHNLDASTLRSLMIYSNKYQELKLSFEREEGWEGSLLAKRNLMPKYKNLKAGEDTPVLDALKNSCEYATQFEPELYCYIFHDSNTSGDRHKEELLENSYDLNMKKIREFKQKLGWI